MPKKLTMLGVLGALALGAVALFQGAGTTYAGPGGKIQNFNVTSSVCYGTAPVAGGTCAAGTDTTAVAGTQYTAITLVAGSRLTLPIQYTPGAFTYTAPADATTIGRITSKTDIFCDGAIDILSTGGPPPALGSNPDDPNVRTGLESAANLGSWPDPTYWLGFPSKYYTARPAYVSDVKPAPATYGAFAYERADFYTLWVGGDTSLNLFAINQGVPTPLDVIYDTLPAAYGAPAGLRVSAALLSAAPNPPSPSFATCLDSPQDSVSSTSTTGIPGAGMYARWTVYTSGEDVRSGQVARVIDLNCTTVGAPLPDLDGDCLTDGSDPVPGVADADGDLVVDGIEAAFGTDRADADEDGDLADDLVEMFQFTNPHDSDTDDDGSPDLHDDGADETPGTKNSVSDTAIDDNCPSESNASQANTDSGNVPFTSDSSNVHQDLVGDACDDDLDNDDMSNVAESGNYDDTAGGGTFCAPAASGGSANFTTDTDNDSDNDIGLDGMECKYATDPSDAGTDGSLSQIGGLGGDGLGDGAEETFYRTQKINKPGGGQEDNPDGDGNATGDADSDSDNDGLTDGREVKFYGTEPSNNDSDQDICSDGREVADVTGDRLVNVIDLSQVAAKSAQKPTGAGFAGAGRYRSTVTGEVTGNAGAGVPNGETFVNYDFDKDGDVDVVDLQFVAPRTSTTPTYLPDGASPGNTQNNNSCPAQGDRGVLGTFEAVDGFSVTYSSTVPVVEP